MITFPVFHTKISIYYSICVSKKEQNIFSQGSYTFSCTVFEWQSNGFLSYDVVCKGVITVQRVFGDNIFGLHISGQDKLKNLHQGLETVLLWILWNNSKDNQQSIAIVKLM